MFTGFASENTPAIQIWDCSIGTSTSGYSISLPDDCAPIQVFRTGGSGTSVNVYLPYGSIEGKTITIINQRFGNTHQKLVVRSSDVANAPGFGMGTSVSFHTIGPGGQIIFVFDRRNNLVGASGAAQRSGWISLNQSPQISANYGAVILGGNDNNAAGLLSSCLGGESNGATGNNTSTIGGSSNLSSALNSSIVGGSGNASSGNHSIVLGGTSNTANSLSAGIVGGNSSLASASYSFIGGGQANTANQNNSAVIGGGNGTVRLITGNFVTPSSLNPVANASGVQQTAVLILGTQTTDATVTTLRSNTSAAGTTNQVILPNNSAYTFQGTVIATITGGGNTSGWKFEGVIKRGANAASTTLVAAVTPTVIAQDAGAAAWVVAVTADTTNGGIKVEVTGAAATTIRWVCKIETTEVTY